MFLGVSDKERATQQLLGIDVALTYAQPPQGCVTDHIEDTICYSQLAKQLTACVQKKAYHLLEHVAHELYELLLSSIGAKAHISVKVTKLNPPVANLFGGASYEIAT